MKLLETTELDKIRAKFMDNAKGFDMDLRLEAYSCKMITVDKRRWKKCCEELKDVPQVLSPPEELPPSYSTSPVAQIMKTFHSRADARCSESSNSEFDESGIVYSDLIPCRTLFDLRTVLTVSFDDYDFSDTSSAAFSLISNFETLAALFESKLSALVFNFSEYTRDLWTEVDKIIHIRNCRLYSYQTGYNEDPYREDRVIWSFAYFFYNKQLNRLFFLSCRCMAKDFSRDYSAEQLWGVDI